MVGCQDYFVRSFLDVIAIIIIMKNVMNADAKITTVGASIGTLIVDSYGVNV